MKRVFAVLLITALLLAGCSEVEEQQPNIDLSGIRSDATEDLSDVIPMETEIPRETLMSSRDWTDVVHHFKGVALEFVQKAYSYSGGELSACFTYRVSDEVQNYYWNFGDHIYVPHDIGVFLFLDGRIQPYRTAEETEYGYMHTFTVENLLDVSEAELYFTPVTGNSGDDLELQVMCVISPEYFIDQGQYLYQHTACMTGDTALVSFTEDPPAFEIPQVQDRVVSVTSQLMDVSNELDRGTFEVSTQFMLDADGGLVSNAKDFSEPVKFRMSFKGDPTGEYSLMVFVDNVPVSVNEEDLVFFSTEEGKKITVWVELDLSDFGGKSVVYGILVPRNCLSGGYKTWTKPAETYYLSDAANLDALMGWE